MRNIITLLLLVSTIGLSAQATYFTRTAHLKVKSTNSIKNIEADNYQVFSSFNTQTGALVLEGLIKSFEFKFGAANRIFNSKKVNVSQYPKIKYVGEVINIKQIDFSKPGTHQLNIKGMLYIWDEKRVTPAQAMITIHPDSTISGESSLFFLIEEKNVTKTNQILKEKLPSIIDIDVNDLGISRKIYVDADMTYKKF